MVDPVIRIGPGRYRRRDCTCLRSPTGEPLTDAATGPRLIGLSKIKVGGIEAERGADRLRHQPMSAGCNPISTLPAGRVLPEDFLLLVVTPDGAGGDRLE
jgi:hypothetical protein